LEMSIDFILPDIGEGIVECELVEWLVSEGEQIEEDQPIADVMTDKALVQIPAMYAGVVEKLYYKQGDIAKVHAPLFAMQPDSVEPTSSESPVVSHSQSESKSKSKSKPEPAPSPIDVVAVAATQVKDFILPDIGEGIVECELVEWLVTEGELIEEDQAIADVMTDKALVQIPAMHAGKVVKLYYAKGDIAKVHSPLFAIEIATTGTSKVATSAETTAATAVDAPIPAQAKVQQAAEAKSQANGKALASPAVRRIARELNVNIHEIPGSGKKGRVYKDDVTAFSQGSLQGATSVSVTVAAKEVQPAAKTQTVAGATRVEPIRGIKAAMARAMVESVATIPHFTYCEEIDMTNLIKLRSELKEVYAKQDIKLTMMPFFMKAMSLALRDFPVINAQVNSDCSEITYFDDHNIGMAVDSKVGLIVPNVKQVQLKSILDLAMDISRLTQDARSGRVSSADIKGGTITISNIGAIGGTIATPIINKPEAAIVALGKLQTLPRFNAAGEVEARSIMQVSWSGDHRIIDGGAIARFCNVWKSFLEQPTNMLVHMR
jgi:2-oxoisovalerate dehydrogenase E2 component (dihydrolipoyl transacylase)